MADFAVPDAGRLVEAAARLHLHPADALVLEHRAALEHVDELQAAIVPVPLAVRRLAGPGPDDVRHDLAARRAPARPPDPRHRRLIALIQRVAEARVRVAGETVGEIGPGVLALIGVERRDSEREAERLVERMLGYRIFPDAEGKMNLSLLDIRGELLAVPQFTLAADTKTGTRAGFSTAATPEEGRLLFDRFVFHASEKKLHVKTGTFGANMKVSLVNDGPVTFWLRVSPAKPS